MKIKFIGTGSGKTSLKRFHSSILVSISDYNLLIDCGDSTAKALLKSGENYNSVNGIIFTHLHPDHFSGLGSLLVQMKINNRQNDLDIFIARNQLNFVREYILNLYLLPERMNFKINFYEFENNSLLQITNTLKVIPRKNNHLSELQIYTQYKKLSFDSYSLLISDQKSNLVYTSDIGTGDDLYLFKENKLDLLISETTHVSDQDILAAYNRLLPGRIVLTHITDEDETKLENLLSELKAGRDNFITAFDGLEIIL